MALIKLDKTWSRNQRVATQFPQIKSVMVSLKDALVESGHWVVTQSSNSVLAGVFDYWVDNSSVVHGLESTPHSWIVLRNSEMLGGNFEICIDFNGSSYSNISVHCTHTGYNVDGTTTNKPTAFISGHEQTITNQQNYNGLGTVWRVLVLTSSDGQCTRCLFTGGTTISGCCGIWLFDKLNNPPPWMSVPYIAIAQPRSGSGDYLFLISADNYPIYSNYCNASGGIARCWHNNTPIKVTFGSVGVSAAYGTMSVGGIARSDTGAYPVSPIYAVSQTVAVPGFLGQLFDLFWLPTRFGDLSINISNTGTRASCPLIYLPTEHSERGLFNWGVWAFGDTGEGGLF